MNGISFNVLIDNNHNDECPTCDVLIFFFFFFSSRRRHTRCREVSWARRCVQETGINAEYMGTLKKSNKIVDLKSTNTVQILEKLYEERNNSMNGSFLHAEGDDNLSEMQGRIAGIKISHLQLSLIHI
eukprot:TRINITY_DN27474_c0_g1_i1.p2 TRINITY_DN27474_c0_g1~~TRINITY_DN27474_c0_g1_i1.p2  ORF type:complete len:128 (-),score=42.62 TRINITY_DN27474_c0_g1_i1:176-559(-)